MENIKPYNNLNDWLVSTTFQTEHGEAKWDDLMKAYAEVQRRKQSRKLYLQSEKGKEYNRLKAKTFYERHKDEILEKRKNTYETNKDVILSRSKAYYETHKEQIKEKQKQKRQSLRQECKNATEKSNT